jgi:hypothetical protein
MAARDLDRVVELGAVIAKLRGELRAHERELAALLATIPVAPQKPVAAGKRTKKRTKKNGKAKGGGKRRGETDHEAGSTTSQILDLLRAHPKDVFAAAEVARHVGAKVESVRTMLMRLVEAGDIRKTGRGAFRA